METCSRQWAPYSRSLAICRGHPPPRRDGSGQGEVPSERRESVATDASGSSATPAEADVAGADERLRAAVEAAVADEADAKVQEAPTVAAPNPSSVCSSTIADAERLERRRLIVFQLGFLSVALLMKDEAELGKKGVALWADPDFYAQLATLLTAEMLPLSSQLDALSQRAANDDDGLPCCVYYDELSTLYVTTPAARRRDGRSGGVGRLRLPPALNEALMRSEGEIALDGGTGSSAIRTSSGWVVCRGAGAGGRRLWFALERKHATLQEVFREVAKVEARFGWRD